MVEDRPIEGSAGIPVLIAALVTLAVIGLSALAGLVSPVGALILAAPAAGALVGLFTIEPNEAAVITFFGTYKGTVREGGLRWVQPLAKATKISLRIRNFETVRMKVNDQSGSPIEIAAVIVWRVRDTARARFAVDDYVAFVHTQAEAALRSLAAHHPYETTPGGPVSLREGREAIGEVLVGEVAERVAAAGIEVIEARLSHLAYASEIAGAMLQRQQADAVVAARARIVEGAVGIVSSALEQLRADGGTELDAARRTDLVANLLLVLCSDRAVHPVMDLSAGRSHGSP